MEAAGIHYQVHACRTDPEGAVLFLHGLGSSGDDWDFQLPVFTEQYEVVTLDLPGHGRSPLPPGFHRLEEMAEAGAAVLHAAGRYPAHVIGLSLGGAVALSLAILRPEMVRSLVLVNTFAHVEVDPTGRGRVLRRLVQLFRGDMQALGETVAEGVFPHPHQTALRSLAAERLAQNPREDYLRIVRALRRFDVRHELQRVQAPCLVVSGQEDTTVSAAAKREVYEHLPDAAWLEVAASGHATPLDAPRVFNDEALRFIQSH